MIITLFILLSVLWVVSSLVFLTGNRRFDGDLMAFNVLINGIVGACLTLVSWSMSQPFGIVILVIVSFVFIMSLISLILE